MITVGYGRAERWRAMFPSAYAFLDLYDALEDVTRVCPDTSVAGIRCIEVAREGMRGRPS